MQPQDVHGRHRLLRRQAADLSSGLSLNQRRQQSAPRPGVLDFGVCVC